jgi:DNA modification methylase
MIPWRVALALQADGWWLRSVIVWHKRSCMPESVTDRPTNSWEPIFLLAKNSRYYYDAEAVREPHQDVNGIDRFKGKSGISKEDYETRKWEESCDGSKGNRPPMTMRKREYNPAGRNQRNVWSLGPEPYSEAHFATFPTEIPKRAILAGTSAKGCCPKCFAPWQRVVEKTESPHDGQSKSLYQTGSAANRVALARQAARQRGEEYQSQARTLCWQPGCECNAGEPIPCTVLDPFGGSGTTGQVAIELGRRAVLVELNPEYVDLINGRCSTTMGLPLAV